ncbi:EthD domain-containing protein [Daldinia vernicosa]|uniref:EthD domain-containing protein n=1 Tax=Daldinia vernicosa TaxID=114800 RepID=UPI002008E695|nr:EthD domain-containing protein [Daldinia vernicosa]KAI0847025.1 EthD domain-containing protein [Daldinia vernicosa]
MTFNVLIFGHRLPGVSPAQFKQRYDEHMSLIQEITGAYFPLSHTRRYIQRADGHNAKVIAGSQEDFDFDVIAEMVFESEEIFKGFYEIVTKEDNAKVIDEDEKKFFDRKRVRVVVLGETEVTERKV